MLPSSCCSKKLGDASGLSIAVGIDHAVANFTDGAGRCVVQSMSRGAIFA